MTDALKILVVDDHPDICLAVQAILEEESWTVLTANGGQECIKILEDGFSGLILLDIMMPDMDGWETIREIESRDLYHKIIICMLTAKDNPDEGMIAIRTGNTRCSILLPMENKALDIPTISLPIRILTMKSV